MRLWIMSHSDCLAEVRWALFVLLRPCSREPWGFDRHSPASEFCCRLKRSSDSRSRWHPPDHPAQSRCIPPDTQTHVHVHMHWSIMNVGNMLSFHQPFCLSEFSSTVWRKCRPSSRWWSRPACRTSARLWWLWGSSSSLGGASRTQTWPSSACGCTPSSQHRSDPASSYLHEHRTAQDSLALPSVCV